MPTVSGQPHRDVLPLNLLGKFEEGGAEHNSWEVEEGSDRDGGGKHVRRRRRRVGTMEGGGSFGLRDFSRSIEFRGKNFVP